MPDLRRQWGDTSPSRFLWGGADNGYCGLLSQAELVANKQAVWKFTKITGNLYTISNASRYGTNECLWFTANGQNEEPSRYLGPGGDNGYCGFGSQAELLANKQAVWRLTSIGGNQFTIANASRDGSTNECLIFGGNGQNENPSRFLWGGGDNGFCGLSSQAELLANKQAIWTLTILP